MARARLYHWRDAEIVAYDDVDVVKIVVGDVYAELTPAEARELAADIDHCIRRINDRGRGEEDETDATPAT